jgi:hypothetical protein
MTDLQRMSRILYHHDWVRVEDWARNIEQLADLSDEQIRQLESCCPKATAVPAATHDDDYSLAAYTLARRTWRKIAVFCDAFRLGVRRAY